MNADERHMRRALALAARGQGYVEPNPMVGCVVADGDIIVGEGWHRRFGGPHAEIEALQAAGPSARNATLYVTLEPCCHFGKTPPCTTAILESKIRRVVVAMSDPYPQVAGLGIRELRQAGVEVEVGICEREASELNAPYLRLIRDGRPWVIAKWAMTLDGKIATRTGHSRWISNESSRKRVHALRGRADAILVGRRSVELDDPLLTARPAGARIATRIVLDGNASLSPASRLVQTARETPLLVVCSPNADALRRSQLESAGCEVWTAAHNDWPGLLHGLLKELGRRRMTNLLVEGGALTVGGFLDAKLIDEVHVFISPKIAGGQAAPSAIAGIGVEQISDAIRLRSPVVEMCDEDIYVHGRLI